MKLFSLLLLIFTFQNGFVAQSWALGDPAGGGPVTPAPRDYSVSPNYYREHCLNTYSIGDIRVSLEGDWSDSQVKRLAELLKELNSARPKREASVREWTYATRLVFKIGDQFEYHLEEEFVPNPAAIWGSGISAFIDHKFQIPMTATDDEIKAMIGPNLPEILEKDPKRREKWQAEVAGAMKGRAGLCSRLLGGLFR